MINCPSCQSSNSFLLGVGGLQQCKDCQSIFGMCTTKQKDRIINPVLDHKPVITSTCRYYNIKCLDEHGDLKTYEGWYDFKKNKIAVLNNGVNDSNDLQIE